MPNAALADAVGLRIIGPLFELGRWASVNRLTSLLANILVVGFTFETIKYVAIRATVYGTDEFDERMDGVVYGTTAGLGVATLLNLHLIIDNQGVALAPGVINVVTTALAQACFGGLLGYFMAEAKFVHRPVWFVPAGLVLTSVLSGLFTWLIDEVSAAGLEGNAKDLAMQTLVRRVYFSYDPATSPDPARYDLSTGPNSEPLVSDKVLLPGGATLVTAWTKAAISVKVPEIAVNGPVFVRINDVWSNPAEFSAQPAPQPIDPPVITEVTPSSGPIDAIVTIRGNNFGNTLITVL